MESVSPRAPSVGHHFCDGSGDIGSDTNNIKALTWNVEGLTDVKLIQICTYMDRHQIDVCCIQETRKSKSEYYFTDEGYMVILSGGNCSEREWAGVGCIIAPRLRCHVDGFCQLDERIMSVKVKVIGGILAFVCVYAPHNLKDLGDRLGFYEALERHFGKISCNGPRIILGDLNARLGARQVGEDEVLGEFSFGREAVHRVEVPNRDLLLENA